MNYLIIRRINGGFKIRAGMDQNPEKYGSMKYYGYSKREAVRLYRDRYGLRRRHLLPVEY